MSKPNLEPAYTICPNITSGFGHVVCIENDGPPLGPTNANTKYRLYCTTCGPLTSWCDTKDQVHRTWDAYVDICESGENDVPF